MKVEIPNHLLVKVSGLVSRGIKAAEINEDGILIFTLTDGTKIELGSVKGEPGPRGESGVYVGTGEMPEDCNVQIDPSGEAFEFIQPPKTARVGQALLVKSVDENGKPTEWETGEVQAGSGGTNDHSKLINRDAADQHPIGAITGLEAALAGKQPTGNYLTNEALAGAVDDALAQAKASGEFDGADGKTAYQYAQDGGYTGTETEFAEKLAAEIPAIDNTLSKAGQAADAAKVGEELSTLSGKKVSLPKDTDGNVIPGTVGWYAVSDGAGGITWMESAPSGGATTHGIVWDLVNVTSSNNNVSVSDGASLVAVLTPADGYVLGDVTITMGGEVITGAWNADTATVTIPSVTGDVIISCAGVAESVGEIVDTSPVIAAENTAMTNTTGVTKPWNGLCVTEPYTYTMDIDALKETTVYDAENDYVTSATILPAIKVYNPGEKYVAAGYSTSGLTNASKCVQFRDGNYANNMSAGALKTSDFAEVTGIFAAKNTNCMYSNSIKFVLSMLDKDDAYAYWYAQYDKSILPVGVRDGDIIFAGKNTPYYGMANIDGTLVGGESTPTTTPNEEASVMMLSFDRAYVDTGEYTEDLKPKWDGMFSIHRGYSTAPNNTLQAIWEAKKHGYNCCELDVRYSSDNYPVLSHDATITGTVDGEEVTYTISETPLATLQTVCIGNTAFQDAKVCSLEDAMRLCRRIGMRPEIDYKVSNEQLYKDCVTLSMKYGLQDDTLHCCYGISYALVVKAAYAKANLRVDGSLLDSDTSLDEYLSKPGNLYAFYDALACGKTDGSNVGENAENETRIPTHKAKGYKMYVWNVTPYLLPDVMQWEPDILQPNSSKDTHDFYSLIRELNSFDGLVW